MQFVKKKIVQEKRERERERERERDRETLGQIINKLISL